MLTIGAFGHDQVLGSYTGFQTHYFLSLVESTLCFYKPCTSVAPEREFNHANRILHLNVGPLVYKVSRFSKCQGYLSLAYPFTGCVVITKQTHRKNRAACYQLAQTAPETFYFFLLRLPASSVLGSKAFF